MRPAEQNFSPTGLTTIGIGLLGDKGLSKVGTAAKTIDKVSDAAKRVKIEGSGPQPALAGVSAGAASKGGALYNVLNDPVSQIKAEIDRVYDKKGPNGTGNEKRLESVTRIKEIRVDFKRNIKHDSEEFVWQLKEQEKGMNELTVDEYLKNREMYLENGRAIEGNAAQQAAREKALNKKIEELFESGMSWEEAETKANSWLKTKAALHNPDQIAGGNPLNIGGVGDKRVNSSIGSQWKYRIDIVDDQIDVLAQTMTPEQRKNTYLNINLTN